MQRHPILEYLSDNIEQHIHATDAHSLSPHDAAYVLPLFTFENARTPMGRKTLSRGGKGQLSVPVRIAWDIPSVGIITDATPAHYRLLGAGWTGNGSITLTPNTPTPFMHSHGVIFDTPQHIKDEGQNAYWSLLQWIEGRCTYFIPKIATSLAISIFGEHTTRYVATDVELDAVVTEFVYGREGTSMAMRIIERACRDEAILKADFQLSMVTEIKRDLKELLRRHIGDPRVGSNVRSIAENIDYRDINDDTVTKIQEAYTLRHGKPVGEKRVREALSIRDTLPSIVPINPSF